jgi:hypothetical protein
MADRKVYLTITVSMILRVDEGVDVSEVVDELDYNFTDTTDHATVEDTQIQEIISINDSK